MSDEKFRGPRNGNDVPIDKRDSSFSRRGDPKPKYGKMPPLPLGISTEMLDQMVPGKINTSPIKKSGHGTYKSPKVKVKGFDGMFVNLSPGQRDSLFDAIYSEGPPLIDSPKETLRAEKTVNKIKVKPDLMTRVGKRVGKPLGQSLIGVAVGMAVQKAYDTYMKEKK